MTGLCYSVSRMVDKGNKIGYPDMTNKEELHSGLLDNTVSVFPSPSFSKDTIIIVGGYGSGKSEVAVNLARLLVTNQARGALPVSIIDLDIVNPYFRSREATVQLERLGIRAIHPRGDQQFADLPIILPDIKAGIKNQQGIAVLDVGGDDVGARVLSSLADAFTPDNYEMLFVLNANRPFTATAEGSRRVMAEIEVSSRLTFTGLISNSHLLEETSRETVLSGLELAREVSQGSGLPISFLSTTAEVLQTIDRESIDVPVLPLTRFLLKPWEKKNWQET
jgi:hypothetical protein